MGVWLNMVLRGPGFGVDMLVCKTYVPCFDMVIVVHV